jgi:outer membrane protein
MKKILVMAIVSLFLAAGLAMAQEAVKIGYVDMKKAMNDSKPGKTALNKLDKTAKEKQGKIDKEKKKLETMQADFEKKAKGMSDAEKQDKQKEFQDKVQAFQKLVGQTQQEFTETQADYTKTIFADMKKAIAKIAKAENFTLIIEKTDTSVLFSKDGLDLTDKVIDAMNE